ncbi:flavin monoamine oxidase family protein [Alkalicoccus luteus]|uniref:FAD-dependent oxidoreductase n=1 Tax=Alkalicoccus luteus TaxID=1237094 RepID=A0A969PT73_9BACI|nr:NAD(P)/FAD-dependent oxidoreductase [Alkalicoccus luteus]NJP39060.1 FAD-dependent oxidoreductase [Alkalicoccus luteus]
MSKKIIVVGAGFSGLAAAHALLEMGCEPIVLEADSRIGGKVKSEVSDDGERFVERGAQIINPDMTDIVQLAVKAGFSLIRTGVSDDGLLIQASEPKVIEEQVEDHEEQLEYMQIETERDDIPLTDLYKRLDIKEKEKRVISSMYGEELNVEPHLVSAAGFLSMNDRYPSEKEDTTHQVNGPLTKLAEHLAAPLKDALHMEQAVTEINTSVGGVSVSTESNTWDADGVIIAVPPTVAARIKLSELAAKQYEEALHSYVNGSIIKITWEYNEAFWTQMEVEGEETSVAEVIYTNPDGVNVIDSSMRGKNARLTMFIGAATAESMATEEEDRMLEEAESWLTEAFGEAAASYTSRTAESWVHHPFCGGGYGDSIRYGHMIKPYMILREPHEGMVFASSELAETYPHFMEGALRAGRAAAGRLIVHLQERTT